MILVRSDIKPCYCYIIVSLFSRASLKWCRGVSMGSTRERNTLIVKLVLCRGFVEQIIPFRHGQIFWQTYGTPAWAQHSKTAWRVPKIKETQILGLPRFCWMFKSWAGPISYSQNWAAATYVLSRSIRRLQLRMKKSNLKRSRWFISFIY